MIRNAQERICISSLYLGTGKMEEFIVEELLKALKRKPNLKLTILLDANRALRIENNNQTHHMLNRLIKFVNFKLTKRLIPTVDISSSPFSKIQSLKPTKIYYLKLSKRY
jgi:phosphatidylserine/phosphatidylglycerophosphate/cardiolipin synthase-like enzyme